MRQRLGLAQALVNRPEVLFLDEPVSALDPAGRKEVLEMIEGLRGQCTVFMSTHILADVERVCDTVGIINQGKLVVEARQDELLARYTLPAFELEVDPETAPALDAWVDGLQSQPWLSSISLVDGGSVARLVVKDVAAARRALLPLARGAGLALRRYEIVTPSLEDIFLRLVGQEEQADQPHQPVHECLSDRAAQRTVGTMAHAPLVGAGGGAGGLWHDLAAAGQIDARRFLR